MIIKRIGVLKLAIFQSAMMAAFGLIVALSSWGLGPFSAGWDLKRGLAGFSGGPRRFYSPPSCTGYSGSLRWGWVPRSTILSPGIVGGIEIDVE